jgi:hypothetical protein
MEFKINLLQIKKKRENSKIYFPDAVKAATNDENIDKSCKNLYIAMLYLYQLLPRA